MDLVEPVKRLVEKATGIGLPDPQAAVAYVRECRASRMKFGDDGYVPNNPKCALLYYKRAFRFGRRHDPAAVIEQTFAAHDWAQSWRNGIYTFVHYHSMTHEVLGVARGSATLRLGGNKGRTVKVSAGDVIIVPAGVGHECLKASTSFLAVGAYPPNGTYNECRGSFQEREKAIKSIRHVAKPRQHPLYGSRIGIW
jgi:uncharacterized protein YjlB